MTAPQVQAWALPAPYALADWLTPGTVLAVLALFALTALLLAGLVRLLVLGLRPAVRTLDARLASRRGAASPPGRRSLVARVLEANAAELLLVALAGAVLLASGGVLVGLIDAIAEGEGVVRLDHAVFAQLQTWRQGWLDTVMVAVTELGGGRISVAVGVAVFGWLAWRRAWIAAAYWVGALIGARACVMVLKMALQRPRPASIYSGLESFSFPSGHAASSMVTYGFLAFLLCVRQPWRVRIPVLALTAVAVTAIGLSRLYLGMHWLSDVLAGYVTALAWIALLGTAYVTLHVPEKFAPGRLGAVAAAAVMVVGAWLAMFSLPGTIARYQQAAQATRAAEQAVPMARDLHQPAAGATPAVDRSCGDRCPALPGDSPPR